MIQIPGYLKSFQPLYIIKFLQNGLKKTGKDIKRICIIPDGQLHKLSFEALTNGKKNSQKYLIEEYAISYSYSIALLFRKNTNKKTTKLHRFWH